MARRSFWAGRGSLVAFAGAMAIAFALCVSHIYLSSERQLGWAAATGATQALGDLDELISHAGFQAVHSLAEEGAHGLRWEPALSLSGRPLAPELLARLSEEGISLKELSPAPGPGSAQASGGQGMGASRWVVSLSGLSPAACEGFSMGFKRAGMERLALEIQECERAGKASVSMPRGVSF